MTHILRLYDVEEDEYSFKCKPKYVHELGKVGY